MLETKEVALEGVLTRSGCTRRAVVADLADDTWPAALRTAAFRPQAPTAWLAEGVLPYLQPPAVEALVRQVSALSAPGSRFAADFVSADLMAVRNAYIATVSQKTNPAVGALFRSGINDPGALLTDHRWRVVSVRHPGDRDADFGHWVGPQTIGAGSFFVMAERLFPASPQEPNTA